MSPCHGEDRGFDSRQIRQRFIYIKNGPVAQLVEQWTENPCVAGALPAWATILIEASRKLDVFILYKKPSALTDGLMFRTKPN